MPSFLITCCHATCTVPEAFRELFKGSEDLVTSVAGWEPGALNLAQGLAMKFSTPLIHGDVTRLLLDLDHDNEKRWSKISATLPEATKVKLIERHEKKFRMAIEQRLMEDFKRHTSVIHLIIHTAPIADGSIILEYSSSDHARIIAEATVNNLPASEITSR
ncbi:MAG: hypothetical protein H7Y36_05590, partial [Armatimonadetes bacterium]|nr:hypothetical protein [Akkermansiaceae bacterium]